MHSDLIYFKKSNEVSYNKVIALLYFWGNSGF